MDYQGGPLNGTIFQVLFYHIHFCLLLQYPHCGINCSTTNTLHKSIELSHFSPKDCIFLASIMLPFKFYYVGETS
jgi:hypothetical protein